MNSRLQQFLNAENLTQAQFADSIDVARASISHILAGRNKPGFEFMSAMVRNYPALNLEWLISGKGKMYKDPSRILSSLPAQPSAPSVPEVQAPKVTEDEPEEIPDLFSQEPLREPVPTPPTALPEAKNGFSETSSAPVETPQLPKSKRSIRKIVIFFDDNTFEEIQ
jgi:transcriptional regulator with XRE-family HTH domain